MLQFPYQLVSAELDYNKKFTRLKWICYFFYIAIKILKCTYNIFLQYLAPVQSFFAIPIQIILKYASAYTYITFSWWSCTSIFWRNLWNIGTLKKNWPSLLIHKNISLKYDVIIVIIFFKLIFIGLRYRITWMRTKALLYDKRFIYKNSSLCKLILFRNLVYSQTISRDC